MISWEDLRSALEGDELYYEAALASHRRSLFKRLEATRAVADLRRFVFGADSDAKKVLRYAKELFSQARFEAGSRFHNEMALCACIVALARTNVLGFDSFLNQLSTQDRPSVRYATEVARFVVNIRTETVSVPYQAGQAVGLSIAQTILSGDVSENVIKEFWMDSRLEIRIVGSIGA